MSRTTFFNKALEIIDFALSLLFCSSCAFCEKKHTPGPLCRECAELKFLKRPFCEQCGWVISHPLPICGQCEKKQLLYKARSFFWLTEPHHLLWKVIKFSGRKELFKVYIKSLKVEFPFERGSEVYLSPIPLFWQDELKRGFNQSQIIAKVLSKNWNVPIWDGMKKIKKTISQSSLSEKERGKNLKRSFQVIGQSVPQRVCLVDDIFTTGSTLQAASKALLKAGAKEVLAVTLFRTPRREHLSVLQLELCN